jgi:hypothetical protein
MDTKILDYVGFANAILKVTSTLVEVHVFPGVEI